MENLEELVPFVREMLGQKPSRGLLKVYLVGSVVALLGTVLGLVETVCHPFSSAGPDMDLLLSGRQRTAEAEPQHGEKEEREDEEKVEVEETAHTQATVPKPLRTSQRAAANRLHAS